MEQGDTEVTVVTISCVEQGDTEVTVVTVSCVEQGDTEVSVCLYQQGALQGDFCGS